MTALADTRLTKFAGLTPARGTYGIKANVEIFKGAMVGLDSAGRAMPAGTAASGCVQIVGKSSAHYDNLTGSELGGSADAVQVEVEFGVFGWANSAGGDEVLSTTPAGTVVYADDDQTVALTSQSSTIIAAGLFIELRDGMVYVWQGPHVATLAESSVLADAGIALQKRTVTIGHADLTDADTSETENIGAVLPANARILGVSLHTVTAFSGGGTGSLVLDIGTAGDVDAIVDGADLFATVVDGQAASCPAGIAPNKLFASAGAQLTATFVTDTTLAAFTAGAVTIDVLFAVLA